MKSIILSAILFGICPIASADAWTQYLRIDCEPSISYFSVHPVGTWVQDVESSERLIRIDNGWSYSEESAELYKSAGSDHFGDCTLPRGNRDLVFSVIRTRSFQPSECRGCGTWGGIFEIRLNGKVLVEGRLGRDDMSALESVQYDGEEMRICTSPVPHHFREVQDGQTNVTCRIIRSRELQELIIDDTP